MAKHTLCRRLQKSQHTTFILYFFAQNSPESAFNGLFFPKKNPGGAYPAIALIRK